MTSDSATNQAREAPQAARRGIGRLLLLGAVVVLAIVGYRDLVHPNLFPKRFAVVVPGEIYRSGKLTPAALTKVVREHEIRTVVDLGAWVGDEPGRVRAREREARTAAALGVDLHVFELIGDATGDPQQYVDALRIVMDPASRPVLVHCGAGTERTGCLVAMYRMHAEGATLDEAYAEADRAGHDGDRNPHLRQVLETWSGPVLEALRTGGDLERPEDGASGAEAAGAGK